MIEAENFIPFVIKTRGGRTYPVRERANAFVTDAYPETLVIAVPHKGITLLGLGAIDSIEFEHETAGLR
jgi:hypothetical protein